HAAKQHELGQGWAQLGEVAAQNGGVERHRLEHAAGQRGTLRSRPVVRVMRIGAEGDRTVVLQKRHHLGRRGEERAHSRLVEPVAENGAQVAQRIFRGIPARRAVAGILPPHPPPPPPPPPAPHPPPPPPPHPP